MSVSAISAHNLLSQISQSQTPSTQSGSSFQELSQALQSGNLSSAQQIFSALNQNTSALSQLQNPQLQQDLNAIGSDLQAGDISGAQKAYSAFKADVQNAASTHEAHHRGHGRERMMSDSSSSNSSVATTDPFSSQSGSISNSLIPLSLVA